MPELTNRSQLLGRRGWMKTQRLWGWQYLTGSCHTMVWWLGKRFCWGRRKKCGFDSRLDKEDIKLAPLAPAVDALTTNYYVKGGECLYPFFLIQQLSSESVKWLQLHFFECPVSCVSNNSCVGPALGRTIGLNSSRQGNAAWSNF